MPFLPFVPFTNCVEVKFVGILQAQLLILTAGFSKGGAILESDMDLLAGDLDAWYHAFLQPLICPTARYDTINIADLTTAVSLVKDYAISGSHDGTETGPAVPNNVALSVTLKTAKRGRSYRGRNYIAGLPAAALTNPTFWNLTVQASVLAAWNDLASSAALHGFTHVVLSRYEANVRRTVGVATPIQSYIPRSPIATMRRRVAGRGA